MTAGVMVKAEGGALPLTWLSTASRSRPTRPAPRGGAAGGGRGFLKLSVIDANGRADRVTIRLK